MKPPRFKVGDLVRCVDVGGRVGLLKLEGAGQAWFSGDHFRLEVA